MNVRRAVEEAARKLLEAGVDAPRLSARLLACRVLGCGRTTLETLAEKELSADEERDFAALAARRARGEPVALIFGEKEFYGRPFVVNRATLVPRPESELLVDLALARLPAAPCRIVDLGAGSGCLGISLCAERSAWQVLLLDISSEALRTAEKNAVRHGVRKRILPVLGDYTHPPLQPGSADCLIVNPPYISEEEYAVLSLEVRDFEPLAALVPGFSGLEHFPAIAALACEPLASGGLLLMEYGAGQGDAVREIFTRSELEAPCIHNDLAGHERCLETRRRVCRSG